MFTMLYSIKQLRELLEEYSSQLDEDWDEWWTTESKLAKSEVEKFLAWLEKRSKQDE